MNLPMMRLETADGTPFDWKALWQRRNVLLLFAHPGCDTCERVLADWAEQAPALQAENTVPIAVYREQPSQVPAGVHVLLDPEGHLASHLDAGPGTVLSVDRFFEVMAAEDAHAMGAEAAAEDSIGWVKLAERQCPECGVGTW